MLKRLVVFAIFMSIFLTILPVSAQSIDDQVSDMVALYWEGATDNQEELLSMIDSILSVDPENTVALVHRASVYRVNREYEDALAQLEEVYAIDPDNWLAKSVEVRILQALEQDDEVAAILADIDFSPEMRPDTLYNFSQVLDDNEQIIQNLGWALEGEVISDRFTYNLLTDRASSNRILDNYTEAIDDTSVAIEMESDNAYAFQLRGATYYDQGQYEDAILDFSSALAISPDLTFSLLRRGHSYVLTDDMEAGKVDLEQYLELVPEDRFANALYGMTQLRGETSNPTLAIQSFDTAIELGFNQPWAFSERAEAHQQLNDIDAAILDYARARLADFDNLFIGYTNPPGRLIYEYYTHQSTDLTGFPEFFADFGFQVVLQDAGLFNADDNGYLIQCDAQLPVLFFAINSVYSTAVLDFGSDNARMDASSIVYYFENNQVAADAFNTITQRSCHDGQNLLSFDNSRLIDEPHVIINSVGTLGRDNGAAIAQVENVIISISISYTDNVDDYLPMDAGWTAEDTMVNVIQRVRNAPGLGGLR